MTRTALVLLRLAVSAAAVAQPDWSRVARVEVRLDNFSYAPATIRLRAGQPVMLRLVNASSGGDDFTARAFFDAAEIRAEDRAAIGDGSVEVPGGQSREIALSPKAGRYPLKCGHTFHKMLGMSGEIVVE